MEALQLTHNLAFKDEVLSIIRNGLHRGELDQVHVAACELLKDNQLEWNHIVGLLLRDRCLVKDSSMFKKLRNLFCRGHKQSKFSALWTLIHGTEESRGAFNMLLATVEQAFPDGMEFPESAELQGLIECQVVNVDNLLCALTEAWKQQKWETVESLMQVAAVVLRQDNFSLTKKGRDYVLMGANKASFIQVVVSLLHKSSTSVIVQEFLFGCHQLLFTGCFNTENQVLLLFFMVVNCRRLSESDGLPISSPVEIKIPQWDSAEQLKKIPDWAIDIETYRGRHGMSNMYEGFFDHYEGEYNIEFHGSRERSSPQKYVDSWFPKEEEVEKHDQHALKAKEVFVDLYKLGFPQSLEDRDNYPLNMLEHGLMKLDLRPNPNNRLQDKMPYSKSWWVWPNPTNFYQLRDSVESVLIRCSHLHVSKVLHAIPQLWTATSLRQINEVGSSRTHFTQNMFLKEEAFSMMRFYSSLKGTVMLKATTGQIKNYREIGRELLLDDSISWHDILMHMLSDKCVPEVSMVTKLAELYIQSQQAEGNPCHFFLVRQAKMDAMLMLYRIDSYGPDAFTTSLGTIDQDLTLDMKAVEKSDEDLTGLLDSPVVHVDMLLTLLRIAWKHKDFDSLTVLTQVICLAWISLT